MLNGTFMSNLNRGKYSYDLGIKLTNLLLQVSERKQVLS